MVSLPTMALDQLLRTPLASLTGQPALQAQHWITDSLMALPLFAAACWAGDLVVSRMAFDGGNFAEVIKRPLIISLFCALFLVPVWFVINKAVTPAAVHPHVAPHASDTGDVYSVPPGVIIALVCVCLAPAAFWLGRALTRAAHRAAVSGPQQAASEPQLGAASTRRWPGIAVPLLLAAAMPVLGWLLYATAVRAYASQVYYAGSPSAVGRHMLATAATAHVVTAPFAVGYQIAHAVQDGLAGQAAGLPALALALLIPARRAARGRDEVPPPAVSAAGGQPPRPLPASIRRQVHPTATEEAPE